MPGSYQYNESLCKLTRERVISAMEMRVLPKSSRIEKKKQEKKRREKNRLNVESVRRSIYLKLEDNGRSRGDYFKSIGA